jgi:NADH dehydrogenase
VKNVAEFFTRSISDSSTFGECYHLGGSDDFSWKELISIIAKASGKTKLKMPAPAFIIKALAFLLEGFSWFPITRDQLRMLMEGNICDSEYAFQKFEIEPIPFSETNISYLYK